MTLLCGMNEEVNNLLACFRGKAVHLQRRLTRIRAGNLDPQAVPVENTAALCASRIWRSQSRPRLPPYRLRRSQTLAISPTRQISDGPALLRRIAARSRE